MYKCTENWKKEGTNEGYKTSTNPFGKYVLQTGIDMKLLFQSQEAQV